MDGIKLVNVSKIYNVERESIKVLNGINLDIPTNKITVRPSLFIFKFVLTISPLT